jgi:dTDP-4-amino-4,6-dideoxygalactose transaminase
MKVPFLDLKAQYETLRSEIDQAMREVIESTAFAGGPFVAKFERDFASFCRCKEAVGVGSGTDALWLALLALGVGPGDEVVTVPNTFIATAEAISFCGATPVFVDVDERTYTMVPELFEKAITPRTRAVIPVHLFGQTADMDPILGIAAAHGIVVVEDACQAHGAEYRGRMAGSMGQAGCFSFYPGKNLGAYGEAGAIVTNDAALAQRLRIFRDHGQPQKYMHQIVGWNARMDGLQGAILTVKLRHLPAGNAARRRHAQQYCRLLGPLGGITSPYEAEYGQHVYHVYAIRGANRDRLMQQLTREGIGCGIHYPIPLHLQEAYRSLRYAEGAFPVAERCAKEFVSLPMYPELREDHIAFVAETLRKTAV